MKILVIEDDGELREEICEILAFEGYKIFEAENGEEGIRKARFVKPHLILCDIMMPDLNGFEVFKKLHRADNKSTTPFIFITALGDRQNFRHGMELGADDYLSKPFTRQELLGAVQARLDNYAQKEKEIEKRIDAVEQEMLNKLEKLRHDLSTKSPYHHPSQDSASTYGTDLMAETMKVIETNHVITELRRIVVEEIQADCSHQQKELLMQLNKRISSSKYLWNNLELFRIQFNRHYPRFLKALTEIHADLTDYEATFVAASFLNLSATQLAGLFCISPQSVRKSRYRIKKKLGLEAEDDFYLYIRSIS